MENALGQTIEVYVALDNSKQYLSPTGIHN